MNAKKLLALLLALVTVIGVLSACANQDQPAQDTLQTEKDTDPADTRVTHDLPPMTFDGYTFGMLHWYISGWLVHGTDLYVEETDGEPVNDAVYSRNARLSEALDIDFSYEEQSYEEIIDTIRQSVRSNDDFYDLYYARLIEVNSVLLEGAFLDYNYDLPYIDLDKPYWDQSVRKMFSFGNHLFLEATDINTTDKDATDAYLFNKKLARDFDLPNFYDLVREGVWTFDELYKNMTAFDGDLNGDGVLNPYDDIMGFLGAADVTMSLFYGGGGHLTVKDEYDLPENDFDNEDNIDLVFSIFDIMYDPTFVNSHVNNTPVRDCFVAGNGLFLWSRMSEVTMLRGEESIDFGILPTPKRDEDQPEHLSMLSQHTTGLPGVLSSEQNPDTVSYIMEAMAAASHYDLQKAYYDITLKTKSARDDESQEMLDLIFKNRILDIGELCRFGGFSDNLLLWASSMGDRNIMSRYKSLESKIETDIQKFIEAIDRIDDMRG